MVCLTSWEFKLQTTIHPRKALYFRIFLVNFVLLISTAYAPRADASSPSQGLQNVTLQLHWVHQFQFAGYYAAQAKGYYSAEGLQVEFREGERGSSPVESILQKKAHFGVMGSNIVLERAQGQPLVVLAAIFQHSPYAIMVNKSSGISAPSDLIDKRIMAFSNYRHAEILAMFLREGIPLSRLQLQTPTWNLLDLAKGNTDALAIYTTNEPDEFRKLGLDYQIIKPIHYGVDFYGDCLFTSEDLIEENPDLVHAFRKASLRGWEYAMENPEEIISWILANYQGSRPQLTKKHLQYEAAKMQDLVVPRLVEMGHLNPGRWQRIADTYAELGFLTNFSQSSLKGFLYDQHRKQESRWIHLFLFSLIIFAGVVSLTFYWNLRLKHLVRERTDDLHKKNLALEFEMAERVLVEKMLKDAKEAADLASHAKSTFLANVSHEIRTPLGAIIGFSELAMGKDLSDAEKLNNLQIIHRNGEQLLHVIDDILDLSKVEASKLELNEHPFSFSQFLVELRDTGSLQANAKGIAFKISTSQDFPDTLICDSMRLRQILVNLIGNAIKFTEKGYVHVEGIFEKDTKNPHYDARVTFLVKDSGVGMSRDQVEKIFQPFVQADTSTSRRFGGTGLGLVLSRQLARLMGGDVMLIKSAPRQGSLFKADVCVRQVSSETRTSSPENGIPFKHEPSPESGKLLHGVKVLFIEDAPDNRLLVQRYLVLAGAEVELAETGIEGVDLALTHSPDIVLMDIQMPGLDGYQATQLLRAEGFTQPILALTAHAMQEEKDKSIQAGCNDHLTKPIHRTHLVNKIIEHLKR
jgi:signal transduction histidine kinase